MGDSDRNIQKNQKDKVVLLHGIARTVRSMRPIENALRNMGYETLSITYASLRKSIDDIAAFLRDTYLTGDFWEKDQYNGHQCNKVHFVTHSMGGLVVRRFLDRYKAHIPEGRLGRVVMIAPPNGGSEVSDLIHRSLPYKWFYGPAGQELTSIAQSRNEGDIYYDLAVIAGRKSCPYIVAGLVIPGENDGRVSVEKTKIAGMRAHVTVNSSHTFIISNSLVHKYILDFLREGVIGSGF
ncbi:MAG: esterase/lipase family protein [Alphaproteobacteria bacterium]